MNENDSAVFGGAASTEGSINVSEFLSLFDHCRTTRDVPHFRLI
jgi:hypothetical protein